MLKNITFVHCLIITITLYCDFNTCMPIDILAHSHSWNDLMIKGCSGIQIDIIFLLDTSTSMGRNDFKNMLSFVKNIVSNFDIDSGKVRVGLFTFSSRARLEFSLNSYLKNEDVLNAIDNIPQTFGNTNTASALNALWSIGFMTEHGDRRGIPNVAVLVTDGVANMESRRTIPEAELVKDNDIFLYGIGVKLRDYSEFRRIPTPPSNRTAILIPQFEDLVRFSPTFSAIICEDCPTHAVDIVFIIDGSTSVGQSNFRKMLDFVKSVLEFANINSGDVRVGVLTYSSRARVIFNLNDIQDKNALMRAIDNVPYDYGNTNTADALRTVRRQMFTQASGDRRDVKNVVVIITDGISNVNSRQTIPEAKLMKDEGVRIIGIGIKLKDATELDKVATQPLAENRYNTDDFNKLVELKNAIFPIRCKVAQEPPRNVISISNNPRCGGPGLDLVIILDTSTSVTVANFQIMLQGTMNFVAGTDIDSGFVRVGLLVYSSESFIIFNLNTYSTKDEVINAISQAKYVYGRTNTAGAIKKMRTEMFTTENGDRSDVPNVAIVVTDGISNINRSHIVFETRQARESVIQLYAIGVGLTNTTELVEISGSPADSFTIENFEDLEVKLDSLYLLFCNAQPSVRPVTTTCDTPEIDIIFLLDSSTSVGNVNFETMLNAIKGFSTSLDIENGNIRVGCLVYNSNPSVEFDLNSFTSERDIINAIDEIEYTLGGTNTAAALNRMRTRMFNPGRGDRDNAANVGVIITDGVSNIQTNRVKTEADLARREGITLLAIGVGVSDTKELDIIAGSPANRLSIQTFGQLEMKLDGLFRSVCDVPAPEAMFRNLNCGDAEMDIVFLLDSSSNVSDADFQKMVEAMEQFIRGTRIDRGSVRVGVLVYGRRTKVQFHLDQYRTEREIIRATKRIRRLRGEANIAGALRAVRTQMFTSRNGDRPSIANTAVVIANGRDYKTRSRDQREAEIVKAEGIRLFVVAVGTTGDDALNQIATEPVVDNNLIVEDYNRLHQKIDLLYIALCHDPVLKQNHVKACTNPKMDLVMVLDSSTSVTKRNYEHMKNFAADLVNSADIDSGNVRIGILIYSTDVEIQFHLNAYRSKREILNAIKQIPYIYGSTNTASALSTVWREMFVPVNGDRREARDVAILITDGISNINSRRTIPEADLVKSRSIHVYAIGIGLADTTELDAIATFPASDNAFVVREFSELEHIKEDVFSMFCPDSTALTSECELGTVDLVIILDASTSVFEHNFKKMLGFVKDLLKNENFAPGGVRVGIAIFSTTTQIQFHMNEYTTWADIERAIDSIPFIYGSTNTAGSLRVMHMEMFSATNGDRPGVPNVCIIITDGVSTVNPERTVPEARAARRKGIHIYAIGVGLPDTAELDAIASPPASENSFTVDNFDDLSGLDRKIFYTTCPDKTLPPATTKPPTTTELPSTTQAATVPPTVTSTTCGLSKVDAVIILDASTSVTEANFKKMLGFCKDLVDRADVDSGSVRFGALIYSTDVEIQFHLNDYRTSADVKAAIDRIPYIYGSTNSADGLSTMHNQMFTVGNGDRPGVDNIAFMITDGVSNINGRRTIPEAEDARAAGIHIYAIGIGLTDTRELDGMASIPASDNSFNVQEFDELSELADGIFNKGEACGKETPETPQCGRAETDLVFILDSSTSVREANFIRMLQFCKDLLEDASIDSGQVRVGILIYSTDVEIIFHLNKYTKKRDVFFAIDDIPYIYGSTNTADAIKVAHEQMFTKENGDRDNVDNVIMLITDGVSNINSRRTIPEAVQARATGIHIFTIGIGLTDTTELDGIATEPASENSFAVQRFEELADLADDLFLSKCPATTTVATTTLAPSTLAPSTTPGLCGLNDVDVIIILDASTSVTATNFEKMLTFVKDLLKDVPIDSGSVRVGAIIYSSGVEIQFHLNQYSTRREIFDAVDSIPYIYGSTNSADALATMHNVMFTEANGDRPGVDNIAFMITDGISNINARRTVPEAEAARDDNIHIYAIGIGLTDTRELDGMASVPASENSFNVQAFDELEGLADQIFGAASGQCTVGPTSPPPCGLAKTDIIIVLDASTSVTGANFQKMRQFVKDFLSTADIDSGSVRAGVAIYSTGVEIMFHLDEYTRSADIMTAIDNIPYIYGSTNTADSIAVMRDEMFTYTRGDRPDAPNVAIVITDGVSNINPKRTIPEAEAARDVGIHIYAIGIGLTDTRELDAIASVPASANSFNVQSFDELEGLENKIFTAVCPKDPVDGTWSPWDDWSECPVSCGTSTQIRVRSCTDPAPSNGGLFCEGDDMDYRQCDAGPCPIDGGWTRWVIWSECSHPCGGGTQYTTRTCTDPEPQHRGAACSGRDRKTRSCNNEPCARDGNWATWGLFGPCSVACGGGEQLRFRTCTDPEPQNGGAPCAGPAEETSRCNEQRCGIDGMWSTWNAWGRCSRTCGGGSKDRRRYCTNPAPQHGGEFCRGEGAETMSCNDEPCPTPRTIGYDVIFVLDSSVSPDRFRWMISYTRISVREMKIDNGLYKVGFLIYSGGAYKQFDLNSFDTKVEVNNAIDKIGYRPGPKNTATALKFVRKRMFRPMNGDRDYAKNYVIVLTGDGDSTDKFAAANEACQLQSEGVGMFSVGLGPTGDLAELDAYSSQPTHDYEILIQSEDQMGEVPGLMLYKLKTATPDPSPCPTLPPTTPRPPRPKGKCSSTGDVVFILDSSGSVGQDNFYRLLNFTYETVEGLDVDSGNFRVGVITFSDTSQIAFHLGDFNSQADVRTALTQVGYVYGNTHTAHALRRARMEMFTAANGDRSDIPNVVVIITDGQSNVNHELTIPEARSLKATGVTIITVAVGFTSETSELVGITSPPTRENLIYVEDYESLGKLKEQLIEPLCTDSDLCRNKPCQNGGICMDGIRSFSCMCPTDYFGDTCSKHCGEPADVVLILDSSTSVGEYNFGRLKEYAEHLVREMNKDACSINIGFLKYSSAAMVQVHLGMYADTEINIRALEQISYTRGRANMAAAFRTLRTEMFNGHGGDRPEARNIAYLLTDGTNDVNAEMTEPEAELTISSGVRVIPIGINLREKYELENIAGAQGIQLIEINDEPALIEKTDVILNPLFGGNDFCIENPCLNGGSCVDEPFGFVCECRVGFTGDTCQKRCSAKGDVVFAVDTSRYVSRRELKKVRRFLRSIIKRMRFKKDGFSVGIVEFADWSKVRMDFTTGTSKKAVKASIAGLRVHGGDPEPAQALAKANYRIFNRRGDTRESPNYLILVTKSMRQEIDILDEANKLKVQGTRILGVGLGLTNTERDFLQSTVSMPYSDTAMFANDVDDLKDLSDRIVDYMCDDDDLCAVNPCRNGGKCTQLGGDFFCECGTGYAGKFCENRCNARADIVFLLDSSGSVGHVDFRRVKQFVHNLVGELTIDKDHTRVGLATYSSQSRHGFFMREYYNKFELQNAIAGIRYEYGNTNTAAGLRLVRDHYFTNQHGDRVDIQNFLIVITDGLSNVVPDQTLVEANLLKENGVHVYAIGVGSFDPFEINNIASAPSSENAYLLKDYSVLGNITSSIVRKTCRDPTVCDENPCVNGGVCIPGINGPFCECLPGFRGEDCGQACTRNKDILFLLDSSDSVGADNFKTSLTFINSIVEEFSAKDTNNRFSLMTFSDKVQIVFSLGRYRDLQIIQNAIRYTRYRPGNTNIAEALRTAIEISVPGLGDRRNADNIVFLITDGQSNVKEEDTIPAAVDLKATGARVIAIGVNMPETREIAQIASSETDLHTVATYNDLDTVREELLAKACKNGDVESTDTDL